MGHCTAKKFNILETVPAMFMKAKKVVFQSHYAKKIELSSGYV